VYAYTLQYMNYSNTVAFIQPATGPSRVCEGSNVTLQCVIVFNGNFVQSNDWSRNGIPVTVYNNSGTFNIPNHNVLFNSTAGLSTDLVITNVSLNDNNVVYNCAGGRANITSSLKLNVTGMYTCTCRWYTYIIINVFMYGLSRIMVVWYHVSYLKVFQ